MTVALAKANSVANVDDDVVLTRGANVGLVKLPLRWDFGALMSEPLGSPESARALGAADEGSTSRIVPSTMQ